MAPSAIRFIIVFSWFEEVSEAYQAGNHPGYKVSSLENRSLADCLAYSSCSVNRKCSQNEELRQML